MSGLKSILDLEVQAVISQPPRGERHKSPEAWEDQIMYFMLPDRFSDSNESGCRDLQNKPIPSGTTPLFRKADAGNAASDNAVRESWLRAGGKFVGGTIKGVTSKLGYLKRMGVTAIWIGPIFKQVTGLETYHGYGVQDFLQVDQRFGTREDLKELVRVAHAAGMYVVLDVILNHSGDVFSYTNPSETYNGKAHQVKGFWTAYRQEHAMLPFGPVDERKFPHAFPNDAVWPVELQDSSNYIRKGEIRNWDTYTESVEGDFFGLKKFNLGSPDIHKFVPTKALDTLCKAYEYWLAYADLDGFRIDTVRHMGSGPTRYFTSTIRTFARSLGKNNFLLVGEISDDTARDVVAATGLDAALGIGNLQKALNMVPRNRAPVTDYFDAFTNAANDPKRWTRDQIVNMIDDHDQIWKPLHGPKARFCADAEGANLLRAALGLNLCSSGIPCVYYGTEQNFDGTSAIAEHNSEHFADQFIRETMFGGKFGAFQSRNRHFFDEASPTYCFVRDIAHLRAREIALRRGHQFLCPVSPASLFSRFDASNRRYQNVIAWLRVYGQDELLCAINTSTGGPAKAFVLLPKPRRGTSGKDVLQCLYPAEGSQNLLKLVRKQDGGGRVFLNVPSAGFVIYKLLSADELQRRGGNM